MSELMLNIGSGQRPFNKRHWVNIDKQARWNPDVLCDFGNPLDKLQFEDDSVDMIVLHHVLEHYGCGQADGVLKECHRLLKLNGSLLVFVPDMRLIADLWREQRIDDQTYMLDVYGAYMGDEADRHKWGYTLKTLKATLFSAGFRQVYSFNWREIKGADIARDDRWILGVEAIK
jgi:predicted SAM-dependent methyltransferase